MPLHQVWNYTDVDRVLWAGHLEGWLPHRSAYVAYTLFMYENLRAVKRARTQIGIAGCEKMGMIFHVNTDRLIAGILDRKQKAARK